MGPSQWTFVPLPFVLYVASYCGATLGVAVGVQAGALLGWFVFHIWLLRNTTRFEPTEVQSPALLLFDALLTLTLAQLVLAPLCRPTMPILTGARDSQPDGGVSWLAATRHL